MGVSNISQQSNYTYNGYAQLTNLSVSESYGYSSWHGIASNGIAIIIIPFGVFLLLYSALYVPWKNRRGE